MQGRKAYKTGDRGYIDELGQLFVLGRRDHQVKIRGIRVELDEIEKVIARLFQPKELVVLYNDFGAKQQRLIAFIVGNLLNEKEIKEKISNYLPDYMVPEIFVKLKHLPRNLSNKIDRKSLKNFPIEANEFRREAKNTYSLTFNQAELISSDKGISLYF